MPTPKKCIVVLGPTSSGKSDLAVLIAKKFNGEVVSADSRQVYRGMDIGSGKVTKKEMAGIRHHVLDIADPRRSYSVSRFKKDAERAIQDIRRRGKLPILCGGTGFYIQAIVDDIILPEVRPNTKLRKELSNLSVDDLFERLTKLDPRRAKDIDGKNPHRLIRAIEIATELGTVPRLEVGVPKETVLEIGIETDDDILKRRIHTRLLKRMRHGMTAEVRRLHESGVSWKRLEELGLEYKYLALYLQGKLSKEEMLAELETAIWHYAKRQRTWFKRDDRIHWVAFEDTEKIYALTKNFLER